jgi:hypothetical protein
VEAAGDLMVQALLDVMEVAEFMHSPALEVSHASISEIALIQSPKVASQFFGTRVSQAPIDQSAWTGWHLESLAPNSARLVGGGG